VRIAILRRRYAPHGGGERFVDAYLRELVATGHEVHLFSQSWPVETSGVTMHRVPMLPGASLGVLSYALAAPRLARAAGVALIHSFERTLDQDVYRAGEGCHRQWLELRRCYLRGRSFVGDRRRLFHHVVLAIERRLCRSGATRSLVSNSLLAERGFERHYAPLRPVVVLVRNGVDVEHFHPDVRARLRASARQRLGLDGDRLVLLAVGSGFERKGLATTLRALAELARTTGTRPLLLVAGRGDPAPYVRLAGRAGVADQLRFLGTVQETRPLYAAADVFVMPTVYDPASNATLEALAMGVPVITTATNGSSEIVEPGRSGWLLSAPADIAGLTRLLAEALDPVRRRAVGEAGRGAVVPYTWPRHVDEMSKVYRGLGLGS
jgi:UDP-glucose:(heptosyl)LPS alpha-1,3-glucosyltransferase